MTESGQAPSETKPARSTIHFLVPSNDGASLLVQAPVDPSQLRLPERVVQTNEVDLDVELGATAELLGPAVPPLRIAPLGHVGGGHHVDDILIETEPLSDGGVPPGHTWHPLADVAADRFVRDALRPAVGRWLDEQRNGGLSPKRPVWSQRGFVSRASAWMRERLEEAGTPLTAEPRLTSLWGISAFLQAQTAAGRVFFKSCAAVFATEPEITRAIDRALPGVGPTVVAIEPEPRWLLMRDVGGSPLGNEPPAQWAPGLAAFGGVQRAWADAVARLPAGQRLELEDRTPARLAEILPALVEDPGLGRLSALERARLIAELPRFVDACDRITELGPPSSLVHGDFHPWNIHVAGERFTVIDWSDSCAGHPFLDLPTFIGRTRDVAARHAMLDAYLAGWAEGYERSRLEEAAQLGLVLGSFHQVESYRRIIASLDPEDLWDLAAGLPNYARRALAWLDGGLEAIPEDDHWSS